MAQNFGIRIDLEAALFRVPQNEAPAQEGGDNGHRVPVLEQRVGPKRSVLCRAHLSNLGEPDRQNKFMPMHRSALLLTFLGQKASIQLQGTL
jgi:hypothetical protein